MTEQNSIKIDYSGNSHSAKQKQEEKTTDNEERVKREPIIEGVVVKQKKPLSRKFAEAFTGDDAQSVGNYVFMDVIIPAAKNMFVDAVTQGIERMIFGEAPSRRSSSRSYGSGRSNDRQYTPYNKMSEPEPRGRSNWSDRGRATHNFDEIILKTRGDAERVLDTLAEVIDNYDVASVADLLDLVDITSSYVDNKFGWTRQTFGGARVQAVRNGYLLDLPKPGSLD